MTPDFYIEAVTDAYLRESHKSREELIGAYLFDAFPDTPVVLGKEEPTSLKALKDSLQAVLSTRKPHRMEVIQYDIPVQDAAGVFLKRYWGSTNTPVLDKQGEIAFIFHETVNVTEDVEAKHQFNLSKEREKEALAKAEQQRLRLERLFEQAPAALAILEGPELVYRVINQAYQELFPGRGLLHQPLFEALPELRNQPIYHIAQNVITTGETFEGHEVLIPLSRHEGQPLEDIYWNFIYQALFDERGEINGMLIFALDVTDSVEARREVEKSAEALQSVNRELEARVERRTDEVQHARAAAEQQSRRLVNLFMRAPAAICILRGPDLVYELVNPGYEALFPGRALLGKPLLEALPEIRDNRVYETFQKVYQCGGTHEEPEILIPLARPGDGVLEERYFKYIQQASYNGNQEVDGVLVFAIEITEQVQARKAAEASHREAMLVADMLEKANRQLTRINADLDNFIYTASHDLKAPISNIEMLMGELRIELPPEALHGEVRHIIGMIEGAVQRFKKTISNLTEITKLQQQGCEFKERMHLAAVVREVTLDLEKAIARSGAQIETSVEAEAQVDFPEKNLRSIVYNLLSNALKYRDPKRALRIRMSAHQDASQVVFQVQDNGLGLSAEQQKKLFTMFRRFHDHVEGTGVGLYMVKRIVDNAGGRIEVESQEGAGSTFRIFFTK